GTTKALPELENGGFVHRAGTLYRFHHVLVRDVVYAGTPKTERAKLHRLCAAWLGDSAEGSDELVGYHLEQAAAYLAELGTPSTELAVAAGRHLGSAGIQAWKPGDAKTAIALFDRAIALLPDGDAYTLELMCELGGALFSAGAFARADAVLTAARNEAETVGDRRPELRANLMLQRLRLSVDPTTEAAALLEAATAAIPAFEEHGDDRALGRAWLDVAMVSGSYYCRYAE